MTNAPSITMGRTFVDVRRAGIIVDGSTVNTTALAAMLTTFAGSSLVWPSGTSVIGSVITIPADTHFVGNPGAKLKVAAALGASDRVITIDGVSNVKIEGLEIDGNKSAFATTTEQRHGVYVTGNASNITLRDIYTHDNKGDGLYIGSGDGTTTPVTVHVDNVRCDANHRQGCSLTSGRNVTFSDCYFTNTSGTAPQAGFDIEPNSDTAVVENIAIDACHFYSNAGAGLLIDLPTTSTVQKGVKVTKSFLYSNTLHGIYADQAKGLTVDDCEIYSNTQNGVGIVDNCRGIQVVNNRIYLNGQHGVFALAQFNTKFLNGLQVIANRIFDNSATSANTRDAIRIDWALGPASGCTGAIIANNQLGNLNTSNQRYALTTDGGANMIDTIINGNYMKGTATGVAVLSDDSSTRRVRGNAGLADN